MSAHTFRLSCLLALAVVATGCPGTDSGSDGGTDAGFLKDASVTPLDAGTPVDAGLLVDGGNTPLDAGTASDAGPACVAPDIEIQGVWQGSFSDTDIAINDNLWWEDTIVSFDNSKRVAVVLTYSSAPTEADPGTFYVNYWTAPVSGSFYYCTASYDQPTIMAALSAVTPPDASNPSQGGCLGFAWTQYSPWTPHLDIDGSWVDTDGSTATVTDVSWNRYSIVFYGQAGLGADGGTPDIEYAVTKNPPPMGSDVSTYNRLVWLAPSNGSFYSCLEATSLATAEAALSLPDSVDISNPGLSGCNGGAWTKWTVAPSGG